ncbi:MAG: acyl-homoserine-lactone synthase [Paracoccus sp. (in: a-proteobacteria)]
MIRYPDGLSDWGMVHDYLKLRKQIFVDRLEWPLFHADELEFEQYDSFDTTYVVASQRGEVMGGARLRRTDQVSCAGTLQYSYMIRDACLGILPGLPQNLCHELPPADQNVWELTRMVVNGPREITRVLLEATNDFLHEQGASSVLFLGSPAFLRMARHWEWPASCLGPVASNNDGRFQVIECPVRDYN